MIKIRNYSYFILLGSLLNGVIVRLDHPEIGNIYYPFILLVLSVLIGILWRVLEKLNKVSPKP